MKKQKIAIFCLLASALLFIVFIIVKIQSPFGNDSGTWRVVSFGERQIFINEKFWNRDSGKEFDLFVDNKNTNNMLCRVSVPWGSSFRIKCENSKSIIIFSNPAIEIALNRKYSDSMSTNNIDVRIEPEPGNRFSSEYFEWTKNTYGIGAVQ